jgi:hypothetical protein
VADKTQIEKLLQEPNTCAVCEAMLPDAVDGTLSVAEQQAFDRHLATCVECARELAAARRGAAWLAMLKGNAPEPPAALLQKILAGTTGSVAAAPILATPPMRDKATHGWATRTAALRMKLSEMFSLENGSAIFQPRMAMTAAMAFFSLALTLNLMGVRLSNLRLANFTPSGVRRTVADAGASVSRTFHNNPTVYKVESRVSELRSDDAPNGPSR